jgi:hypothetical protein
MGAVLKDGRLGRAGTKLSLALAMEPPWTKKRSGRKEGADTVGREVKVDTYLFLVSSTSITSSSSDMVKYNCVGSLLVCCCLFVVAVVAVCHF